MSTTATPPFELLDWQRSRLVEFINQADAIIGLRDFIGYSDDPEILALALRVAQILGYEGERLERLFCSEFRVGGVTQSAILGDWLAALDLVDMEKRIMAAAGGRN